MLRTATDSASGTVAEEGDALVGPQAATKPCSLAGRRRVLTGLVGGALGLATAGASGCSLSGAGSDEAQSDGALGSNPMSTALWTDDPGLHLLRRLTFGPTSDEVARIASLGPEAWLDEQLAPANLDTTAVETMVNNAFADLALPAAELLAAYRADGNGARIGASLPGSALIRHSRSPAQLYERLVEFWGDHFNVPAVNPPTLAARIEMDRTVFRPHALGRFDELLAATAQSPAMLLYLDNFQSTVGSINENYARELLELHTVGIEGGYDEDDIVSVARLLTGWGIDRELRFAFDETGHDEGPVSILGWSRPTDGSAHEHGVDFLHHLARLPQTADFVCRKLAIRFVADEPDPGLVAAMAAAWLDNDTRIEPVVRAMVEHRAFAEAPPKFNRPWDYLIQTMRSLDVELDLSSPNDMRSATSIVVDLGQIPFRNASPDGYPDNETAWLNSGGLLARWNLATQLTGLTDRYYDTRLRTIVDDVSGEPTQAIFERYVGSLRQTSMTDDVQTLLAELTGWSPGQVPSYEQLAEQSPYIAFVILTHTSALYR